MPLACTQCRAARVKCDHGDPCSRCQKFGLKCYTRKRKAYKKNRKNGKKRGAAAAAASGKHTKKTKTTQEKGGTALNDALPDTNGTHFISPAADSYAFSLFQHLSPDHWGLQVIIKTIIIITANQASWGLSAAVSWLIRKTGLFDKVSFFGPSRSAERDYNVGDFGHVYDFVMRAHDEKVGAIHTLPWSAWSKDNLGDRVLFVSSNEHIDGGVVSASPCYDEMFVSEKRMKKFKDICSLPMQDGASFMYGKDDFTRCTHAVMDIMAVYETRESGPLTRCVTGVTISHPKQGKIKGNNWVTIYCGQDGLDGVGIHEFIPGELATPPTGPSVKVIGDLGAQDRSAAEAMVQLFNKK